MEKNMTKYFQELREIQEMSSQMKKMNESIMFEDDFEDSISADKLEKQDGDDEEINDIKGEEPKETIEDKGLEELDNVGVLDKIRIICLDGMRELAKKPESPQFVVLNKIFAICNKGIEEKDDFLQEK